MFKVFFIILFPYALLICQDLGGNKEIYTRNEGLNSTDTIYYRLKAVGPVWDETFYIDTKFIYNGNYYTLIDTTILINDDYTGWGKGWDQIRALGGIIEPPFMGNGIYEFFIKRNYNGDLLDFYIDFRDDDWPGNYPCGNDIYVYYSGYNHEVWIRWGETSCDITYPHNKTFYQIWTQKGKSFPTTTLFNNFWQNCLVIIPTNNNHPKLVWGPNPVMSNDYYKIYKKKDSPDFILYDSTTSDSYVDINEDIVTGPHHSNETDVYYKVTSVGYPLENPNIPPYESGYTNTADVRVSIPPPQKPCVNNSIFKTGYSLAQNYPNPFNPTTKIDYSIKSAGFVSLKVYNMLGEEVATLINKNMEPGSYSVTFDASNLPSGIYVYRLSSRNFSLSKKLILLK